MISRWRSQIDLDNTGTTTFHVQRVKDIEDSTRKLADDLMGHLHTKNNALFPRFTAEAPQSETGGRKGRDHRIF